MRVNIAKSILGARVISIRHPHRKTIKSIPEIKKELPITNEGVLPLFKVGDFPMSVDVEDIVSNKEQWKFVLELSGDGETCSVSQIISPDNLVVNVSNKHALATCVPADVQMYAMLGEELSYKDVVKNQKDNLINGNIVVADVDVRYVVYRLSPTPHPVKRNSHLEE